MNRTDLSRIAAKEAGITIDTAARALDAAFEAMAQALSEGDDVGVPHFGRFTAPIKPAHTARNPATGETVEVPDRRRVKFKPSTTLVERVR